MIQTLDALKGAMLEASYRNRRWTKGQARHGEMCWWNHGASNSVNKKGKLWKEWKKGNVSKEKYLEAKKRAKRAVY